MIAQAKRVKRGLMEDLLITGGLGSKAIMRGKVPEGWQASKLGDVCAIQAGVGFPNKHQGRADEKYPYYKVSDMNNVGNEVFMNNANNTVSEEVRVELGAKILPAGTVIFPKIGAAIATNKKRIVTRDSLVDNNMIGLIAKHDKVSTRYLYYIMLAKNLSDFASMAGVPSIRKSTLAGFTICFPPFSEQKRIAEILSSVDESLRATRAVIAQAERMKCGLMEDLLTGGMGSEAIARGEVPEGYRNINFLNAFIVKNDKTKKIQKTRYSAIGAYPIVDQSSDFIAGYTDGTPNMNFPVVIFGDHTRCVKWVDFPFFTGADGTQALYPSDEIISKFGFYLVQNAKFPNLGYSRHMRELKRARFAIPQKATQQEIVDVLDTVENYIKANCKTVEKLRRLKHGLMDDLLTGCVRTV